jgi:hypothetical protein
MFRVGHMYLGRVRFAALELQYNGTLHLIDCLRAGTLYRREVHGSYVAIHKVSQVRATVYILSAGNRSIHTVTTTPASRSPTPTHEHKSLLTAPIVRPPPLQASIRTLLRIDSARPSSLGRELVTCSVERHGVRLYAPDVRLG